MTDLHVVAAARLRADSQRYTTNRRAVVELLEASDRPLSIPQMLADRKNLAQSSVYRNLVVLEDAGVVRRIVTNDEFSRYELAEDLTGHHHHLICSKCGAVDDFTVSPALEAEIEKVLKRVAKRHAFAIDGHRLDLIGACADCNI